MNNANAAPLSLLLCMLLASFDASVANVVLPELVKHFGAPFEQVRWVLVAHLAVATVSVAAAGRLGDRFGRRRLLLAGIALSSAGAALSAAAPSLRLLVAARALQGLGGAMMMALSTAILADITPKAQVGRAMGALGAMSAAGTALGPSLGGLLLAAAGWRAAFLAVAPLGAAALLFAGRTLAADAQTVSRRPAPWTWPPLDLVHGLVSNALVMTVLMGALVVAPFYLSVGLGLGPAHAGLILSAGPIVAALSGYPAGRLTDRLGSTSASLAGLAVAGAGCLLLAGLPATLGVPGFLVAFMLLTSGYALFQAANGAALMGRAAPESRGGVSGLLNLSRNLGRVLGAWAMGALFASVTGTAPSAAAVATGARATFAVSVLLIAAAGLITVKGRYQHE